MVKQLNVLLPAITTIINMSLAEGFVQESLKSAIIMPLLKKGNLEHKVVKNYRPVSNLTFICKVLERVVAKQPNEHIMQNNLHEPLQSAYKQYHSIETPLLKVHNDIMWAMERKGVNINLNSVFDTIDHMVLITRLHSILGVDNIPLARFESYLRDRSQCVYINRSFSSLQHLSYVVPKGSVLAPLVSLIYNLPVGAIMRRHG